MRVRRNRLIAALLSTLCWAVPGTVRAGRGGPDALGWVWRDSNEPGIDASVEPRLGTTVVANPLEDDRVYPVALSFPFTLYGTTSSTVWVSSNGWISLVDPRGDSAPLNSPIPSPGPPGALIAYYWDDMAPLGSNRGYEGPTENGHQIQVEHNIKATGITVECTIQFYTNGSLKIVYRYGPLTSSATIGIEDASGNGGTQLFHNGAAASGFSLANDYAVLFHPRSSPPCSTATPFTHPSMASGSTTGGSSLAIAYGCGGGEFRGRERVHSLRLAAAQDLTLNLSGTGSRQQAIFLLRPGCDGYLDCIAGGTSSINLALVGAGTYYVVVDGRSAADDGAYTLTGACVPQSLPIACGQTLVGQVAGASRIDRYECTGRSFNGPETIHDFSIPGTRTVTATITPDIPWDIMLVDAVTLAPVRSPCLENGDEIGVLNLPAGNYSLVVDTVPFPGGDYTLTLQCLPAVGAVPIACGQTGVLNDNRPPSLTEFYPCLAGSYSLGEAYYRFRPAGRVIATASTAAATDYDLLAFREREAPDRCLASGDASVTLVNLLPEDFLFTLDSDTVSGPTSLSLQCFDLAPDPLGCGSTVAGITSPSGVVNGYSCIIQDMSGGESYFLYNNPAVQDLTFAVWGAPASADLRVALLQGPFDARSPGCLAGGPVARLSAAPPGEYLVMVDGAARSGNVPFQLTTLCGQPPVECVAPVDLACNSAIAGDTAAGTRTAFLYQGIETLFPGPERVYRFANPVRQPVNFLLKDGTDPRLDLVLLRACDASSVVDWGDEFIAQGQLDPGEYYLVVDGREGASGSFDLVTLCGPPRLEPARFTATVEVGQCASEAKRLYYPIHAPQADLAFSMDLSESMTGEIGQMRANARTIFTRLNQLVPSLRFGLSTYVEYDRPYTDTVCGVDFTPLAPNPYPYRLDQPLTADIDRVEAVLQGIDVVGGGKETYNLALHQSYSDPAIGWRDCARRLWINFGDELPIDCNVLACIGGVMNEGQDPGPDLVTGTADDLYLLPTVDAMGANGIQLLHVDSSETAEYVALWDCVAARTGGRTFTTDRFGRIPGGSDPVPAVLDAIRDLLRTCPELRLEATGPYASWATVTPVSYGKIAAPFYGEIDIDFCVPPGTPAGVYTLPIEARCIRPGPCAVEVLGTQSVEITVTAPCPVALAPQPPHICEGQALVLDGSGSTACNAAGLLYRWLEGTQVLCDWSGSPTCAASPATTTAYTLEVICTDTRSCIDSIAVTATVEPLPAPTLAPLEPLCGGGEVWLDASASDPRGCSAPLEYRFLEGTSELRSWSAAASHGPLARAVDATFTVEARCPAATACQESASTDLTVVLPPSAVAGEDRTACKDEAVTLDGSASLHACPAGARYEWWEDTTQVSPPSPDPTWMPATNQFGTRTYRLVVTCAEMSGCSSEDEVEVAVRACGLAVTFDSFAATARADGTVQVSWRTLAETDTLGFLVERGDAPGGPFAVVARTPAQGPGRAYAALDAAATGTLPWYRIVEITSSGRGDATPTFQAAAAGRPGGGAPRGARDRGRTRRLKR